MNVTHPPTSLSLYPSRKREAPVPYLFTKGPGTYPFTSVYAHPSGNSLGSGFREETRDKFDLLSIQKIYKKNKLGA